jgi:DMSO/TMAO reductase YedYZ molybdopterin-dependent catalytic subunit
MVSGAGRKFLWFLVGAAAVVSIPALLFDQGKPHKTSAPKQLEIREYQGQRLGSVGDFRENSIGGVQKIDIAGWRLVLDGLVERRQSFSYDELRKRAHLKKLVTLHCVEGWKATVLWEGIPLRELFRTAVPKPAADTVVFRAVDGYATAIPLKDVVARDMIIADRVNGIDLPPAQGYPFILVAEEKWGYKWIRWLNRIEFSADRDFRGTWEKMGYSLSGERRGPIFDRPGVEGAK